MTVVVRVESVTCVVTYSVDGTLERGEVPLTGAASERMRSGLGAIMQKAVIAGLDADEVRHALRCAFDAMWPGDRH